MKEEMILRALRMIGERCDYWDKQSRRFASVSDCVAASAYDSAFAILNAAVNEDSSALDQFDYYGEE